MSLSAFSLELLSNKEALEFQREYNLSKKPLQIDLLIIKKLADVQIENEIGRISKYNILEYKSPGDRYNVDAVLQASIYANKSLYDEIRRDSGMSEALRELMKDE